MAPHTETPPHPAIGRVQSLLLTPRSTHTHLRPFYVTNVHLSSSSDILKRQQLKLLLLLDPSIHHVLLGDFNFTETQEDAPSHTSTLPIRGQTLSVWTRVLQHLKVSEIPQPIHTHYFLTHDFAKCRTSRIDRIYTSHTDAELTVIAPSAYLPPMRNSPINAYNRLNHRNSSATNNLYKTHHSSDHVPVNLTFSLHSPPTRRGVSYPAWLGEEKIVLDYIEANWEGIEGASTGYEALENFKRVIGKGVKTFNHNRTTIATKYHDDASRLTALVRLYALTTAPQLDLPLITAYIKKHPTLSPFITLQDKHIIHSTLAKEIDSIIITQVNPLLPEGEVTDYLDTTPTPLPAYASTNHRPSHHSLLDEIKEDIPSDKKRLQYLRASPLTQPTDDPHLMGGIIDGFWGPVWGEFKDRPSPDALHTYLADYTKTINPTLTPIMPSLTIITKYINGSGNSCSGPNGIPFIFYRKFADLIAPCFLDVIESLSRGEPPPPGFNHARLFLIPKNSSLEIRDTRPISVTNTDNRIIAKIINDTIAPSLADVLHSSQKGFVPGRVGTDHIEALTNSYYSNLSKNKQYYILFLDTAKAFDSIDHAFIHACLAKIGLPLWVRNSIACLLTDVVVFPILSVDTGHSIPILRGVKQGCPLSPLLFALCYDILLEKLANNISNSLNCAFADDLAVGSPLLSVIVHALIIIKTFSRYSGLGLNIKKTSILPTLVPSYAERCYVEEQGFKAIKFVNQAVYLGVLVGQTITTTDIFRNAHNKFISRVSRLQHLIKRSSLHKRITIFNVFILPVYYYLAQLYIIPIEMINEARNITHRSVVSFNGGAFAYSHLITSSRSLFGPHTPLRDLWSTNYAFLASKSKVSIHTSHNSPLPILNNYSYVSLPGWGSLIIPEHCIFAAFALLEDCNTRGHGGIISTSHISGTPAQERAAIYKDLVRDGYWRSRNSYSLAAQWATSLPRKLARLLPGPPVELVANLRSHVGLVTNIIKPTSWNHHFKLVMNALATDTRMAKGTIHRPIRPSPHTTSPYPCYFCHKYSDHYQHFYSDECSVTAAARVQLSGAFGVSLGGSLTHSLLANPPTTQDPLTTTIIFTLNHAIWVERRYASTFPTPPKQSSSTYRIVTRTLTSMPHKNGKPTPPMVIKLIADPPPTSSSSTPMAQPTLTAGVAWASM